MFPTYACPVSKHLKRVDPDGIDPQKFDDNSESNVFSCGDGGSAGQKPPYSAQFPAVSEYSNLPPEQRGERAMRPTTFREVSSFWPKIALLLKFSDLNFPTEGNECCNLNVH